MLALIGSGTVIELAAASFPVVASWTWVDVTAVSPQPQVGWAATETNGVWAFAGPAAPPAPTLTQQAEAAIYAGIVVSSTGTPALNGTYGCDPSSQANINAVMTYILANQKFPGASATYSYADITRSPRTFPTTTEFQAFASAVADYVSDLYQIASAGQGVLPSNTKTIA